MEAGMIVTNQDEYRRAFVEYLRKGTPIRLQTKQAATSGQYVWRTRDDDKVRPSHRANDGHVFDWSAPPATGHPGSEYGCRCQAVPYVSGATEFAFHVMQDFPPVQTHRYGDFDFVAHYYYGGGRELTLSEIGHLREIAEHYAYVTGNEGAFRRLSNQIADEARKVRTGNFSYDFEAVYDFGYVEFSHGDGVVSGEFSGTVSSQDGLLRIAGESRFRFTDRFEDPVNLGIEVGGDPYDITGECTASFSAEVFADSKDSEFTAS
jgi:SPP1 gp7 family putative phage head morphogenesis protein